MWYNTYVILILYFCTVLHARLCLFDHKCSGCWHSICKYYLSYIFPRNASMFPNARIDILLIFLPPLNKRIYLKLLCFHIRLTALRCFLVSVLDGCSCCPFPLQYISPFCLFVWLNSQEFLKTIFILISCFHMDIKIIHHTVI